MKRRGPHASYRKALLLARQGNLCCWCGQLIKPEDVSVEHIIPLSRGGRDTLQNSAAAHAKCNHRRGAQLIGIQPHPSLPRSVFEFIRARLAEYQAPSEGRDFWEQKR